ncbi:hypothetical protein [Clostridium sp. HMP27]|uniref:hypothetical protein n=1 Tax=Clostridium sp. HMP27 TaxID=1487921 RepID=UPI00068E545D|nr:hypothetical protein [Clostridium sp. HMP27]
MNKNKIKNAFSNIKASEEFKNKLANNLKSTSIETKRTKKKLYNNSFAAVAAILLICIGLMSFKTIINKTKNPPNIVTIPKIELPNNNGIYVKMIPLIVYNGKIYTSSHTIIDSKNTENLLGEKLGRTKANINEWSKQTEYSKEFASNIGEQDVYTVKDYDKAFRIMTNIKTPDGASYPEFYDCLNGITINTGADVFGKLNLKGNVIEAKFRSYNNWNNGVEAFSPINDIALLNRFLDKVNKSTPYSQEEIETSLGDYRNDDEYKELILKLKDGCEVSFTILKSGYVYYGYSTVYFKINDKVFEKLWNELTVSNPTK